MPCSAREFCREGSWCVNLREATKAEAPGQRPILHAYQSPVLMRPGECAPERLVTVLGC
jgi:hypothetical protein